MQFRYNKYSIKDNSIKRTSFDKRFGKLCLIITILSLLTLLFRFNVNETVNTEIYTNKSHLLQLKNNNYILIDNLEYKLDFDRGDKVYTNFKTSDNLDELIKEEISEVKINKVKSENFKIFGLRESKEDIESIIVNKTIVIKKLSIFDK